MTRQVITADGIRLAVREFGATDDPAVPTVVCVHGYPDNQTVWDGVATRLAERFHVVTYDVRGAGDSDKPHARAAYRLDRLEADLAAVLDAVSPHSPVHLLGHDWGSIQAWHAVTGDRLHGRLASFTSISGPCLDHAAHWFCAVARTPTPGSVAKGLRQLGMSTYIGLFQLPVLPELAWRTGLLPRLIETINRFDPASTAAKRRRPRVEDGVYGLELYRANMLTRLRKPRPRHARIPVQILAPTADPFVSPALQESAQHWTPELWVRRVRGGHWLPRSAPDAVARHTAELIDRVSGA